MVIYTYKQALRIAMHARARARLNRRLRRTYAACGCDVLADHARRAARFESKRAYQALSIARAFRSSVEN